MSDQISDVKRLFDSFPGSIEYKETCTELSMMYDIIFKMLKDELNSLLHLSLKIHEYGHLILKYAQFLEVRPSPLHGNGVFTTAFIPKGVVVTCYPMDFIQMCETSNSIVGNFNVIDVKQEERDLIFQHHNIVSENDKYKYTGSIIKTSVYKLGHLINDYCKPSLTSNLLNDYIRYLATSFQNTNVKYQFVTKLIPMVVSKRDIVPNEELTCTYDFSYWLYLFDKKRFKTPSDVARQIYIQICKLPETMRVEAIDLLSSFR